MRSGGRTELETGRRQLDALRTKFSTELERAREAVTLAQERAEASERRSLRELGQERTARQKSERTAEDLRGELAAARHEARDAAVAQVEGRAKLEAQAAALVMQHSKLVANRHGHAQSGARDCRAHRYRGNRRRRHPPVFRPRL
ncbi:hypothetical protein CNE_BB1p07790 (plasmid) [Cupriavidus necator N-1]|uniref:KfrA protein n=1 Tax=Cupriavidus necator (strain ATCC 43291 / DSM 13513 / CCUG 52238 / LMG 8453 / N-1) TaxID=1042878 RepID=F8GXX6_CUPNN|nr:hypothetical protein CNE_BB1p07790 [Cupriavidus necator N-1]